MNYQGPENYRGRRRNGCKILAVCEVNTNLDISHLALASNSEYSSTTSSCSINVHLFIQTEGIKAQFSNTGTRHQWYNPKSDPWMQQKFYFGLCMEPERRVSLSEPLLSPSSLLVFLVPLQLALIHNLSQWLIIESYTSKQRFFWTLTVFYNSNSVQ